MKSNERLIYTYKGKSYYLYFLIIAFLLYSFSAFADEKAAPNYSQVGKNTIAENIIKPVNNLSQMLSMESDSLTIPDKSNDQEPAQFVMYQNSPNPFNAKTTISYKLPGETDVELMIYDADGQIVKILYRGIQSGGSHRIAWDGTDYQGRYCVPGMYIAHMQAGEYLCDKRVQLVK